MKGTNVQTEPLEEIPGKRYFTIGEVAELCGLKAHVLRYWEQEFPQLNPVKRRGNRRYYQRDDVLLIRDIRHLLYEEGFTIQGARQKLSQRDRDGRQKRTQAVIAERTKTLEAEVRAPASPAGTDSRDMSARSNTASEPAARREVPQDDTMPSDFQMAAFKKQKGRVLEPATAREWRQMLEEAVRNLD